MAVLTRAEGEDFLYREARLLDERRFSEWLGLFDEDCRYWVPCGRENTPLPITHLMNDDRGQLEDRVWQLQHPRHSSQSPASTTAHFVSNVEVEDGACDQPRLHSVQLVYEMRMTQGGSGAPRAFAARCQHHLRWDGTRWRIASKTVWLLDRDLPIYNLTFLL